MLALRVRCVASCFDGLSMTPFLAMVSVDGINVTCFGHGGVRRGWEPLARLARLLDAWKMRAGGPRSNLVRCGVNSGDTALPRSCGFGVARAAAHARFPISPARRRARR